MSKYMSKELIKANSFFAIVGVAIAKMLGGWDMALQVLVAVVCLDYLTGVLVAISEKQLSSEIGYKGLLKKMMIFLLVYLAVLLEKATGTDVVRLIVIMFYIANEGISILENAGKIGVPYPEKIKNILLQLKSKSDSEKVDE